MTNEEKRAVIERLTLSDIETLMRDEASAYLVQSGLKKILTSWAISVLAECRDNERKGLNFDK